MAAEDSAASEADDGSMWQLYAEYGRENAGLAVVGAIAAIAARMLGLLPALVLGLAIDAILLAERPFSLPFVPDSVIPADPAGQLWLAIALLLGATITWAALSWVQNYGWNRFAQRIQHTLRVDAYEALQDLDRTFFDGARTGTALGAEQRREPTRVVPD